MTTDEQPDSIHTLTIHNLRDLHASCACGGWELTRPTTDRDTDEVLRRAATKAFNTHAHDEEADVPVIVEATCGCLLSEAWGVFPPCAHCERCETHCSCPEGYWE